MSEPSNATQPRTPRPRIEVDEQWELSDDGSTARRSFPVESAREASKLAGRIIRVSVKKVVPITLTCDGVNLVVSIPRSGGAKSSRQLDRAQRGVAQRLDRFLTDLAKKPDPADEASL